MKKKRYNPDPQSWEDDLPEVDDFDEFDAEPEEDESRQDMIDDRGIDADPYSMY